MNIKKISQLLAIALGICGAYLTWHWYSNPLKPAKIKNSAQSAETEPIPTPTQPPPENSPENPTQPPPSPIATIASLSDVVNPYESDYKPSLTGKDLKKQGSNPNTFSGNAGNQASAKPKKSSGGGGKGGGGGGKGGSGGGGGTGGVTEGVTEGGTPSPTPDTKSTSNSSSDYWIQTGDDPRGETPSGSRHNSSCIKYENVPGRKGSQSEGSPCIFCKG